MTVDKHGWLRIAKRVFFWAILLLFGVRLSALHSVKGRYSWGKISVRVVSWSILLCFLIKPSVLLDGKYRVMDALHGMENHSVVVSGRRVHYLAAGPVGGSPVVLVHGLGGIAEDWTGMQSYLTHAGFRVYMPELIGYGQSDKPADYSYSVRDEADMIVGFFNAIGLKEADLCGWSMGGWIAQIVASEHPERVRRLILIDSAGLRIKPDWDTRLFAPVTPAELNQFLALLMPHPPKLPTVAGWAVVHVRKDQYWVIRRAVASMLTEADVTDDRLPALKMPVLIVWGDVDRVFPLSQGESMHRLLPQSQLDVVPGCGHLAPVQCTAQIGPKVAEFLKR